MEIDGEKAIKPPKIKSTAMIGKKGLPDAPAPTRRPKKAKIKTRIIVKTITKGININKKITVYFPANRKKVSFKSFHPVFSVN